MKCPVLLSIKITFQIEFLISEVLEVVDHGVEADQMSVVDLAGVDVRSPAVLRVELVVKVDPAPVTQTNSEEQLGPAGNKENDLK